MPVAVKPLPLGLSIITAGDLDDTASPRIRAYLPRFRAAPPPDPETGDWRSWESLLADGESDVAEPTGAMNFTTLSGFGTVSSTLIALPAIGRRGVRPRLRFAGWRPETSPWRDIPV